MVSVSMSVILVQLQEAAGELASAGLDEVEPPTTGYVVSKSSGGRCRRLHCLDACWMKPGVHYAHYEVWGELLPQEHEITAVCKHCLKSGPAWAKSPQPSSGEGSSSSSSGGEPEPAPKKSKEGSDGV